MTRTTFGFDFEAHLRDPRLRRPGRPQLDAVAAVRLDDEGRIVEATVEAATLLGYRSEELVGRSLIDLAAEGWRAAAQGITSRILLGSLDSGELLLCGRSGRRTLLRMVARPLDGLGHGGHVVAWTELHEGTALAAAPAPAQTELQRLAYDLLSTQEEERMRVAAELHGGVAPLVVMAKFMVEDALQRLMRGAHSEAIEVLMTATARLRDVVGEVRRISMELRPSLLDDLGLLPTIEWFCRHCERAYRTLRVERVVDVEEADIPEGLKLEIFRIVEEALSNVAQHANARCARVSLVRRGDELELTVVDDGSGFDAGQLFYGNACLLGVGLQSIRKRVDATRGRLLLESTPLKGTVVGAVWKLERNAGAA
jgi:two-component system NarL family sensor kinase